jgi:hypothetical protein
MAAEAEPPGFIDGQFRRFRRMVYRWAVAVFAWDDRMGCFHDALIFVKVAILAVFRALVLYLEILPELDIVFPVPPVHVSSSMHSEILGYVKSSGNENNYDETYDYQQRTKDVTFHVTHLIIKLLPKLYCNYLGAGILFYFLSGPLHAQTLSP